jgi:hypothetical protein
VQLHARGRRDDRIGYLLALLVDVIEQLVLLRFPVLPVVKNHTEGGDGSLECGRAPFGALLFSDCGVQYD